MGGTSYAWNWNGVQRLWIDFGALIDVTSVDLAILSTAYSFNASSVQLFGYDAADNQIASSAILGLTDTFQTLAAGFSSVRYLELRANSSQWFSVDNLVVGENRAAPEPATLGLLCAGIAAVRLARRQRSAQRTIC